MDPFVENKLRMTRRHFFGQSRLGLGTAALACLVDKDLRGSTDRRLPSSEVKPYGALPGLPHFPPKAKRIIYLFQSGAPSQMDLFDYKPGLKE